MFSTKARYVLEPHRIKESVLAFTVGCPETSPTCVTSDAPAACTEADQEPSSILRAQVAAMWASFFAPSTASEFWSIANMKVITAIYLTCRPDLRDEWLTGTEVDDVSDAQV